MDTTDVMIGGGGMVGLTLALALAKGGLDVVVADPVPRAPPPMPRFDGRVSALAYAACACSRRWAFGSISRTGRPADHDILVTDGAPGRTPSPFSLHFDAAEAGSAARPHRREPSHPRRAVRRGGRDVATFVSSRRPRSTI